MRTRRKSTTFGAIALVAVLAVGLVACDTGDPADRYPRRVPQGVDGAHPLKVFNLWPLFSAGAGNPDKPIALTFDDGPSPYTNQILDVLASRNAPATFFVVGYEIAGNEAVIQRAIGMGMRIGDHSWDHPQLTRVPFQQLVDEVVGTQNVLNGLIGPDKVKCMRPPYGDVNQTVVDLSGANGMASIIWDVNPSDYDAPSANDIYNRVIRAAHPGAIVGMHDGGGNRSRTVAALGAIIDTLRAQGYTLVSIC